MNRLFLLAPVVLSLCAPLGVQAAPRHAPKGFRSFEGAWFSVFYPATWKTAPGKKSPTSVLGADCAFFASPDGRAQFAVYSPQWNGNPTELNINPKLEKQISKLQVRSTSKDGAHSQIETRWQTFRALNGSYTRSVVDVENKTLGARRVFGFKYKDAASYKKYLPLFERFKASLEQYSD